MTQTDARSVLDVAYSVSLRSLRVRAAETQPRAAITVALSAGSRLGQTDARPFSLRCAAVSVGELIGLV
ncbi:MAG: hypothetical protein LC808_30235 [Actinobacteria bacterium]|nr:hypothetical protein [Actinomycetota bacterium]